MNYSLSKFKGTLTGALIGDCVGAYFEGWKTVSLSKVLGHVDLVRKQVKKGLKSTESENKKGSDDSLLAYTDDSAMTFSISESLIEKEKLDIHDLANRFVQSYFEEPYRGYGGNVVNVFVALAESGCAEPFAPAAEQFDGRGSYGNGGAMRISPAALFGVGMKWEELYDMVKQITQITHSNVDAINGAFLECLAVQHALQLNPDDFNAVQFVQTLFDVMQKVELRCLEEEAREEQKDDSQTTASSSRGSVNQMQTDEEASEGGAEKSSSDTSVTHSKSDTSATDSKSSGADVMDSKSFDASVTHSKSSDASASDSKSSVLQSASEQSVTSTKSSGGESVSGVTTDSGDLLKYCSRLEVMREFLTRPDPPTVDEVVCELGHDISAFGSVPAAVYSFLRQAHACQPTSTAQEQASTDASADAPSNASTPEKTKKKKSKKSADNASPDHPEAKDEQDHSVEKSQSWLTKHNGFERTLIYAISLGGDTDTIASMACAIAGAFYGYESTKALCKACERASDAKENAETLHRIIKHRQPKQSGKGDSVEETTV